MAQSWIQDGDKVSWMDTEIGTRRYVIARSAEVKSVYTIVTDREGMDFLIGNNDRTVEVERDGVPMLNGNPMPKLMMIRSSGPSGNYETDSDTLTTMMEIYLPSSVEKLSAIINERVTGSPEGDSTYQCSAQNVAECLIILADFGK